MRLTALALAAALLCPLAHANTKPPSTNVAWQSVAADVEVDRAFAQAKAQKKPVLMYWGASWCPPCNHLKATLFNRQEFATLAQQFVAVHVDGDRPQAQKIGARFKASGYPTMILFNPDGAELTRLPGEADAPQVMALLEAGLAGGRPMAALLADARGGKALTPNEWRTLAFHSWETDDSGLVSAGDRPGVLAELAVKAQAANPGDGDTTTRLWLKALASSDEGKGLKPEAAQRALVQRVLADAPTARRHMDVLTNGARDIVKVLADEDSKERAALAASFDAALVKLQADTTLSRADRLSALGARIELARLDQPKGSVTPQLPAPLVVEVKEWAQRLDREIADGYERQAVITAAAYYQGQAGLWADSDALLKSNLAKSHSPYYLMSQLGGNAKKLGKKEEALNWYQQAYDKSVGPATRLQWGASYLTNLVDLAPQDATRITKTAQAILADAAKDRGAFYDRSARSLQRVGKKLVEWDASTKGQHRAAVQRWQAGLTGLCSKAQAAERQACEAVVVASGVPAKG
jgi:thiol-disulfide isomerase/thioredoxin